MNRETLLPLPIDSLPASQKFKEAMSSHGITCLADVLSIPILELITLTWLTEDILEELSDLFYNHQNT